jgi:uncharacterized protein YebE (UPF0316 family)
MIKILGIFIFGTIETYLYTGWNLSANKKQKYLSSLLMFIYMTIYLLILDVAFKDKNSNIMIMDYALACALGNFLRVRQEK